MDQSGERAGLLGPNGAGKTTTLLMLLGVTLPDSGIELLGHSLPRGTKATGARRVRGGIPPAAGALRVYEVLALFADLYGMDGRGAHYRGGSIDQFGIGHLAEAEGQQSCRRDSGRWSES